MRLRSSFGVFTQDASLARQPNSGEAIFWSTSRNDFELTRQSQIAPDEAPAISLTEPAVAGNKPPVAWMPSSAAEPNNQSWRKFGGRHDRRCIKPRGYTVEIKGRTSTKKEIVMPKFMVKASYATEGFKGLVREGGTGRSNAVRKVVESLGGKVEAFYFAYGEDDVYAIADLPDPTTALALSLAINASGAVRLSVIPLISPEEIDAACKKTINYRAPGA
jgi:uncharacterized protein with GYD domain